MYSSYLLGGKAPLYGVLGLVAGSARIAACAFLYISSIYKDIFIETITSNTEANLRAH